MTNVAVGLNSDATQEQLHSETHVDEVIQHVVLVQCCQPQALRGRRLFLEAGLKLE